MSDILESQLHIAGLIDGRWKDCEFAPFREGVDICWLRQADPGIAMLRYAPAASVPRHLHTGLETIVVLDGRQSDENGTYERGSLVLNPEGSIHTVWSDTGCVVLITWERPVHFLDEEI